MPMTDAQETCTRNWYRIEHVLSDTRIWYQKKTMQDCMSYVPETVISFSGTSFWYRFLMSLALENLRHSYPKVLFRNKHRTKTEEEPS